MEQGRSRGKILRKLTEVFEKQNKLIEFKMVLGDVISIGGVIKNYICGL